jgi:hypothetical protein
MVQRHGEGGRCCICCCQLERRPNCGREAICSLCVNDQHDNYQRTTNMVNCYQKKSHLHVKLSDPLSKQSCARCALKQLHPGQVECAMVLPQTFQTPENCPMLLLCLASKPGAESQKSSLPKVSAQHCCCALFCVLKDRVSDQSQCSLQPCAGDPCALWAQTLIVDWRRITYNLMCAAKWPPQECARPQRHALRAYLRFKAPDT